MDSRVYEHAEVLADWSTEIAEGDDVVIRASPEAEELVTALYRELAERGAKPLTLYSSQELQRTFLINWKEEEFETPEHYLSLVENADVSIGINSDPNLKAMSNVPGRILSDYSVAMKPIQEETLSKRWCFTQHPTNAQAQEAEMSLEEYKDFVYNSILIDWQDIHDKQEKLVQKINEGNEVRIVGPETEIEMSIEGMKGENSDGKENMPSGEVFTAPVIDSVNGKILFDMPIIFQGKEIRKARIKFEKGEVVDYAAEKGEDLIKELIGTDEGSDKVGELGIGTNRRIDKFTRNILFDEKMGGTIHMALGRAYEETVGKDRERNTSAIHVDMIKDMKKGKMEIDGEKIIEDGKYFWET
ncbi:hypothetical protein AKJ61_00010 [candidate division MSBL1 archaeon SCGC-AAA259B11]|uniref:Peptidase M29 n=1 Tax=candidate division MSBL1 archaeon SCGC-AAA259B11 TaxID=1698260 RepID=A0A133U8Z5_9EURY|nr:hypothetical protein AKJ61_00010 [candidate division MSBL1 archaeon SCGC-AAA259B11]